ncbi:MAG: F0F1 ATP synthase subunit B [Bacteroidales bacterium]|nr:F0F1 ATP synthase subunit B [Bacteroidales bacterium]
MRLVTPDIGTIFWMVLMFIILLIILKKFAWKPILNALRYRENSIEEALRSADKVKIEMEKLQADNEKIMAEARKERDRMIKETKKTSEKFLNEAKNKASVESKKIIQSARVQIENEKDAAIDDIRIQVAELSVEIAEKILQETLKDDAAQKELMEKLLKDVKMN